MKVLIKHSDSSGPHIDIQYLRLARRALCGLAVPCIVMLIGGLPGHRSHGREPPRQGNRGYGMAEGRKAHLIKGPPGGCSKQHLVSHRHRRFKYDTAT